LSSVGAELRISGVVQGVGYRYYCYREALGLGLSGWVKNAPDGSVLAMVEGDRGVVEGLISQLKVGPASASVADVDIKWLEFTGQYKTFQIDF